MFKTIEVVYLNNNHISLSLLNIMKKIISLHKKEFHIYDICLLSYSSYFCSCK